MKRKGNNIIIVLISLKHLTSNIKSRRAPTKVEKAKVGSKNSDVYKTSFFIFSQNIFFLELRPYHQYIITTNIM